MSQITSEIRKAFFIWSMACIVGLGLPPLILYLVPSYTAILGLLSSTLIISIPLSIAQWIALRRISPVSILWIFSLPASILAFVLIIREIPDNLWPGVQSESWMGLVFSFTVIGLLIALPQWLILRLEHSKAVFWLLGTVLGFTISATVVIGTNLVNTNGLAAYIIAVLIYTIATGLTLSWLLMRKDKPTEPVINST